MTRRNFIELCRKLSFGLIGGQVFKSVHAKTASPLNDWVQWQKTDEEWENILTPEQYYILREEGTERPHTSALNKESRAGVYHCAACDLPLFSSEAKYDSGTGWPSFFQPINQQYIATKIDRKFFMTRVEYHCSRCGGHQGHVFEDGPEPTGLRYCNNGVALTFRPTQKPS